VKTLAVWLAATVVAGAGLLFGQADIQRSAKTTVIIIPAKATLFAGETQTFAASVIGIDDKAVNWSVEEQDGGAITDLGQYTAPKIQGVYHITATSRAKPAANAVATVTVLTYWDPLPVSLRR
jgi:hypothetical protein